jgi:3-methylfumaryl-CoA hydratase
MGWNMSEGFDAWIGRSETATDRVTLRDRRRMAQTLDIALTDSQILPPLWHWMGWGPDAAHADIAEDGHLKRGGFLPPVPLPRRMWAGGRLTFDGDLLVDELLTRRSEILKVSEKTGASGRMVFVTVAHVTTGAAGRVEEQQDIVYVAIPDHYSPPPPQPAPDNPDWQHPFMADPARLFRFSAMTFNAHRIHYDLPYATGTEHYPGLVTHGPMQAMVLLNAAMRASGKRPRSYGFRGVRPAFAGLLRLCAWGSKLATVDAGGMQCMTAEVTW